MKIIGHELFKKYVSEGLQRDQLSPSLLLVGPAGIGKKMSALELTKCFACKEQEFSANDFPRCDACISCQRIAEKNHSDVFVLDSESQATILKEKKETQLAIKIESIRFIEKFLHLRPVESQRRTVIIDDAQKLTNEAANALLKICEEPPPNAQIVLICPVEQSVPTTIVSRCAVLRFRPIPPKDISLWLEENYGLDPHVARSIAEKSNGSFEKAVHLSEEKEESVFDINDFEMDEFFDLLSTANWKKEGRKQAENAINKILDSYQKKLHAGEFSHQVSIEAILQARQQINRNASPKLVLENLYMKLSHL